MAQYTLDKSASRFTVRAFATGMLAAMGHNPTIAIRDFSGEAAFDLAAPEKAFFRMQIRTDSLEVTDDIKSKDRKEIESLMNEKVLESAKFPTITFESTSISATLLSEGRFQMNMNGNLSLHGVTAKIPLSTQVAFLGDMLRASGDFSLLQSNYNIAIVSVGGGALKVKDELKFSFDLVARKQE